MKFHKLANQIISENAEMSNSLIKTLKHYGQEAGAAGKDPKKEIIKNWLAMSYKRGSFEYPEAQEWINQTFSPEEIEEVKNQRDAEMEQAKQIARQNPGAIAAVPQSRSLQQFRSRERNI
jgi:hypothetical protein